MFQLLSDSSSALIFFFIFQVLSLLISYFCYFSASCCSFSFFSSLSFLLFLLLLLLILLVLGVLLFVHVLVDHLFFCFAFLSFCLSPLLPSFAVLHARTISFLSNAIWPSVASRSGGLNTDEETKCFKTHRNRKFCGNLGAGTFAYLIQVPENAMKLGVSVALNANDGRSEETPPPHKH